jgi:hypothetical protein
MCLLPMLSVNRETRKYSINEPRDNLQPEFEHALRLAYVRARSKLRLASLLFILF